MFFSKPPSTSYKWIISRCCPFLSSMMGIFNNNLNRYKPTQGIRWCDIFYRLFVVGVCCSHHSNIFCIIFFRRRLKISLTQISWIIFFTQYDIHIFILIKRRMSDIKLEIQIFVPQRFLQNCNTPNLSFYPARLAIIFRHGRIRDKISFSYFVSLSRQSGLAKILCHMRKMFIHNEKILIGNENSRFTPIYLVWLRKKRKFRLTCPAKEEVSSEIGKLVFKE